jgi:hypothetical protein
MESGRDVTADSCHTSIYISVSQDSEKIALQLVVNL